MHIWKLPNISIIFPKIEGILGNHLFCIIQAKLIICCFTGQKAFEKIDPA